MASIRTQQANTCWRVWYQTLFNTDTIPANFVPKLLTEEDVADLRSHATTAVNAERLREAGATVTN